MTNEHINAKAQYLFQANLDSFRADHAEAKGPPPPESEGKQLTPDDVIISWENAAANYCESPIEQMLLAELIFCSTGYGPWPLDIWITDIPFPPPDGRIFIAPQFNFGNYRIDIGMFGKFFSGKEFKLAIECDGHIFHEKTKEQAQKDRQRDRFLQAHGWTTLRFTGSEIVRDADACAEEIGNLISGMLEDDMFSAGIIDQNYSAKKLDKIGYQSPFKNKPSA